MTALALFGRVVARLAWPVRPGAFRLFLALMVFVHHFSSLDWGPAAVYAFFVLSGFWIETMWTTRYRHARQPYLTYMVSRVWRLAPVMVLVSLITMLLLPLVGVPMTTILGSNPLRLALSTLFLLGYTWLPYLPVGSAWSLDVEMQFYIVAPLLAVALATPKRGKVAILAAAMLCSLLSALTIDAYVLPRYIAFFMVGMTAAHLRWLPSERQVRVSAGLTVALVVGVIVSPWRGIVVGGAHPGPLFVYAPAFNIVLGVVVIPFAIATTRRPSDALDRMMADLSYIVYLQHWVAMQWFAQIKAPFVRRLAVAAASFALVLPASWLIWRFYDQPINRLRARWVASRMAPLPENRGEAQPAPASTTAAAPVTR